jgi:transposase-like protein
MSVEMDEEIKRWTARRKSALVLDIIQGKTTVSESSRQFDLPPSEIESWIDQAKAGMENALKAKPAITEPGDVELINLMMSRMDEAVAAVAEGVLKIIDLKR